MPRPVLLTAKALVAGYVMGKSVCSCVYELVPEVSRVEGGPGVLRSSAVHPGGGGGCEALVHLLLLGLLCSGSSGEGWMGRRTSWLLCVRQGDSRRVGVVKIGQILSQYQSPE